MRIWSFHPQYLDPTGLSRLINESIAGYRALTNAPGDYPPNWTKHPQIERWRGRADDLQRYILFCLDVWTQQKLCRIDIMSELVEPWQSMHVNDAQLAYEWRHYLTKLQKRNLELYDSLLGAVPKAHPMFQIVTGPIEKWERVKK